MHLRNSRRQRTRSIFGTTMDLSLSGVHQPYRFENQHGISCSYFANHSLQTGSFVLTGFLLYWSIPLCGSALFHLNGSKRDKIGIIISVNIE